VSIGLPGLNGFVSEFFTVQGAFISDNLGPVFAGFAATAWCWARFTCCT